MQAAALNAAMAVQQDGTARWHCEMVLKFLLIAAATANPVPYKDPSQPVDARTADLLARMTLAEKVAQLT